LSVVLFLKYKISGDKKVDERARKRLKEKNTKMKPALTRDLTFLLTNPDKKNL